jgi:hypothetical protein
LASHGQGRCAHPFRALTHPITGPARTGIDWTPGVKPKDLAWRHPPRAAGSFAVRCRGPAWPSRRGSPARAYALPCRLSVDPARRRSWRAGTVQRNCPSVTPQDSVIIAKCSGSVTDWSAKRAPFAHSGRLPEFRSSVLLARSAGRMFAASSRRRRQLWGSRLIRGTGKTISHANV